MKRILAVFIGGALLVGCGSDEASTADEVTHEEIVLEVCDCITPAEENAIKCAELYAAISEEEINGCLGETVLPLDSLSQDEKDSVRTDYENDLSLEIKEIEEEKEDPISDDCKQFLEDYADEIKGFTKITEKISANPDDIGLQIQFSSASEEINSWASKPQMFQCSQNAAFQKQIEILNGKRDKLLEM